MGAAERPPKRISYRAEVHPKALRLIRNTFNPKNVDVRWVAPPACIALFMGVVGLGLGPTWIAAAGLFVLLLCGQYVLVRSMAWRELPSVPIAHVDVGIDGIYARNRLWPHPRELAPSKPAADGSVTLVLREGEDTETLRFETEDALHAFVEKLRVRTEYAERVRRQGMNTTGYRDPSRENAPQRLVRVLLAEDGQERREAVEALEDPVRNHVKKAMADPRGR